MHTQLIGFAREYMGKHKMTTRLSAEQGEYLLTAFISDALSIESTEDRIEVKKAVDGLVNVSALNQSLERHGVIPKLTKADVGVSIVTELLAGA